MTRRDTVQETLEVTALAPVAITGTTNGAWIDLNGRESVRFSLMCGAITAADGSNYLTAKLQDADASDQSDAADVGSDLYYVGATVGGTLPVVNASGQAGTIWGRMGYRGYKRYVRVVFTETGTFSALIAASAIVSDLPSVP